VRVKQTKEEAVISKLVLLIIKAWQSARRYTERGIDLNDINEDYFKYSGSSTIVPMRYYVYFNLL
jgi:hypothetical protein